MMFFSFSLFVYNKIFLGTHFLSDEIICLRAFAMFWVKIYSPEQNLNTLQQIRIFLCTDTYEEVLSKNRFAVHGIYLLMKVCCVIYNDVLKKKLEEFYKQTIGACRYIN